MTNVVYLNNKIITLMKAYANIDISEDYDTWFDFLKQENILMTYDEVYEMDLAHLNSCGHDYGDKYINKDMTWNVELLIENDNDIEKISNNLFLYHNAIDESLLDKFEEHKRIKKESIYNIDALINKLQSIRNKITDNAEVYIKDTYSTDEYLRISDIRIDEDGDIIIENNEHT